VDADSLKIVIMSLFKAKKACIAFQLWIEMIKMGVKPDAHGYSSFVIGLCNCGMYDVAYASLLGATRERVPIEAIAYNMVIDGLCKEMKLEEAEKVLELKNKQEYAPDIYGYSYLIRSYCKMGNAMRAVDHCEAMVSHGIEINCHIVFYSALLS
jgi:pentatricopeptide repeat protein